MAPEEASQPEEGYQPQENNQTEENYQRAMVVIAHPDDAEYGCAGTVAKWCRQGMSVVYVVCTDGSKGSPDPNVDVGWLIETRQQEQRNACKVLGVEDVVFLNYEDAMLEPTLELRKDIAREIRRYRPDVMICETPMRTLKGHGYIGHPDHFASGEAAMAAMFPAARDRLTFPDLLADGFEPHKIRELMIMTFGGDGADKWVDVTDTVEQSLEALKQHVSQVGHMGEDHFDFVRSWKVNAGKEAGMGAAETFKSYVVS